LKITIVIPTFNEAENLPKLVPALFNLPFSELEILIVDDNSPDGTGSIADEMGKTWHERVRVLHRPGKLGLGSAYIQGFQNALNHGADAVAQMDADFSHPPNTLVEMARALETHDIALGSRYIPGGSLDEQWPLWRKGLSTFGNVYARTILGLPVRDTTGGFRMWRRSTLAGIPLERVRSNGYVFQVEMIFIANRLGFSFLEIPFHFSDRRWGKSKMNMRIQLEAAFRVWKLPGLYRDLSHKITL
jgi:dolichol-phosphate mannosyltransferase